MTTNSHAPTDTNPKDQLMPKEVGKLELEQDFKMLSGKRDYLEDRLLDYSGWTLPYVYTEAEGESTTEMQHDFQAVGAQAVNHLSNKIATVLFPQSRPFFKYELDAEMEEELAAAGITEDDIEDTLAAGEREAMKGMAKSGLRTAILEALKHLIVLGNTLLYIPNKGKSQVYSMKDYVILRDMSGETYKIITRDTHVVATLPTDIRDKVRKDTNGQKLALDDVVHIYTGIQRTADGRFAVWQEIDSIMDVPRQKGLMTQEELLWIPLAWNLPRGFNYGVGLVEEFAGDFHTYSSLAEALVNMASIVSDIKILVNPMGATDVDELNDSASGTFVYGSSDDISYLQIEKFQDMKSLQDLMDTYARRIAQGFLLTSAAVRDSERTTAEEIRILASELEGSLGGVYGRLAEELQLPLAVRQKDKILGDAFKGIDPIIITGMESLSRSSETDALLLFLQDAALLANLPERVQDSLKFEEVLSQLGRGRRVDYKDFLFTEGQAQKNRDNRLAQENPAPPQQPQPQEEETI